MPKRTSIHNWGINDAPYPTKYCPYYKVWRDMIRRAHSPAWYIKHPTYEGCTVDEQWKYFMNFRQWMVDNNWHQGLHLDKDLKIPGNLHYGPDTCLLVTPQVNTFFVSRHNDRGQYPVGVSKNRNNKSNPFNSKCRRKGIKMDLGSYPTVEKAHEVYLDYKIKVGEEIKSEQTNPEIIAIFDDFKANPMKYLK